MSLLGRCTVRTVISIVVTQANWQWSEQCCRYIDQNHISLHQNTWKWFGFFVDFARGRWWFTPWSDKIIIIKYSFLISNKLTVSNVTSKLLHQFTDRHSLAEKNEVPRCYFAYSAQVKERFQGFGQVVQVTNDESKLKQVKKKQLC